MKWFSKRHYAGEMQTLRWFALLPVSCSNDITHQVETRWLEWVSVRQEYWAFGIWFNDCFVDEP